MQTVSFELPEAIFTYLHQEPNEFIREMRVAAAIKWYELGQISQGKAVEIAGLSQLDFIDALSRYKVSIWKYDAEELATESVIETNRKLSLQEIAALPVTERHKLLTNSIASTAEDFLNDPELTDFLVLDGEDWDTEND